MAKTTQPSAPRIKYPTDFKVKCPDCLQDINVGTQGPGGLAQHQGMSKCVAAVKKRAQNEKDEREKAKTRTLFSMGITRGEPLSTVPKVPSVVSAPPKVFAGAANDAAGCSTSANEQGARALDPVIDPVLQGDATMHGIHVTNSSNGPGLQANTAEHPPAAVCSHALKLIGELRAATAKLPLSVPLATGADELAVFAVSGKSLLEPGTDDPWEVIDPMLNCVLGFSRSPDDIKSIIRRGRSGMEGLCAFLEYFVIRHGLGGALFEGKAARLLTAMADITRDSSSRGDTENSAIDVDEDIIEIFSPSTVQAVESRALVIDRPIRRQPTKNCNGVTIRFPPGMSPFSSYPFGLHDMFALPWSLHIVGYNMRARADDCQGRITSGESCRACAKLVNHNILEGILERMVKGIHENTPFAYQPVSGLIEILHRKTAAVDTSRFWKLSAVRKLASRSSALDDYKKFVMALGDGGVARTDALIRAGLKAGAGVRGLIELLDRAARNVYKPKGFTEEEMLRGVLFLKLGGSRVAEIAHRTLGMPGLSTLRRYCAQSPLIASPSFPIRAEIQQNLDACITQAESESRRSCQGYVLMIDEIAVEKRPRWDDKSNHFLGICREHARSVGLEFCTLDQVEALHEAVVSQDVHLATEATVAAIGLLSDNTRIYGSRPILISGTCKKEAANAHADLIALIIQVCQENAASIGAPLLCVSSDGEARRGKALAMLTSKKQLEPSSEIYPLLCNLRLLDLRVGDNDLTADKDYKHVFKRLRNLFLREKGITVCGTHITPALLIHHLRTDGMPGHQAAYPLNPEDKQDVTLACTLLHAIWALRDPTSSDKPAFANARHALKVFGTFVRHVMLPYHL